MCGIPKQSDESFAESVREAIALGVTHVSVYPLTIEEGTPFAAMLEAGQMQEPDEDAQARHMELAASLLTAAGYERYEVASYAKPGFESRHNTAYWTGLPYLGIGRGAVSMRQTREMRERVQGGEVVEALDASQMLAEDLMLQMRMSQGVCAADIDAASLVFSELPAVMDSLIADGLVELRDGRHKPTNLGWLCGNELYGRLLDLA